MLEAHLCDSARADNDRAKSLWLQMKQTCKSSAEWCRLRAELYGMYELLSFSFGARWFGNKRLSPDDVRQCCRIGVVQAIDAWDPERGSLTTMVAYMVSREIRSWCRVEGVYRTSESQDQTNDSQQTCQDRTRRKCDLTYVSYEDFRTNGYGDCGVDFHDLVMEQAVPSHEEVSVLQVSVDEALAVLDPVKREIVEMYYGLNGNEEHTLRDLEPVFQVSYQTVKNRLGAAHREMAPLLEGYR